MDNEGMAIEEIRGCRNRYSGNTTTMSKHGVNTHNSAPNSLTQHYFGCCETKFKTRFYNHRQSFNHRDKANATELSKTIWKYKDKGIKLRITWSIVCKSFAYTSGAKCCYLCLAEKLAILQADQRMLLNKQSEFVSKCRHWNKFKLKRASFDLIFFKKFFPNFI